MQNMKKRIYTLLLDIIIAIGIKLINRCKSKVMGSKIECSNLWQRTLPDVHYIFTF